MKRAFTLIELLMVIAIIGIISTLAVNKVGGIREAAARKVSVANQVAVERAVGSFLTGNGRLNRLDSLCYAQSDIQTPWYRSGHESGGGGFDCTFTNQAANVANGLYLGSVEGTAAGTYRDQYNAGVTPGLQNILCPYQLKAGQAEALVNRLGLRYVMAHNPRAEDPATYYANQPCADGSYVESRGDNGMNPNESGCIAVEVSTTNHAMSVFAVNPIIEKGRAIYRAFGQDLLRTDKNDQYVEADAVAEVYATGGPLLAFGLSDRASIIGKSNAGLESAPYATYPVRKYYSRYILLIRLRTAGTEIIPEFAGVLDPCGHTVRAAREIIRNL